MKATVENNDVVGRSFVETRLSELKEELVKGLNAISDHESRLSDLHATCLRVEGAITILGDLLKEDQTDNAGVDSLASAASNQEEKSP